jgi:hypothetical protein
MGATTTTAKMKTTTTTPVPAAAATKTTTRTLGGSSAMTRTIRSAVCEDNHGPTETPTDAHLLFFSQIYFTRRHPGPDSRVLSDAIRLM